MILLLEILALEPLSRPAGARDECQLPGMESQSTPSDDVVVVPEARAGKKGKQNLALLLDVHADRLCIWQFTTSDEVKALAESQVPHHSQQVEGTDRPNSDPLKDFCVDIVLPL